MERIIIDETNAEIEKLINQRTAELKKISDELQKANTELNNALDAQKKASDEMNAGEYAKACRKVSDAENVIGMYEMRRKTINNQEMISEEESEKRINSLLQYENDLNAELAEEVCKHILVIRDFMAEYDKNVKDAELALKTWERKIHPHYVYKTNSEGEVIEKNARAIHQVYYDGSKLAAVMRQMLDYESIKEVLAKTEKE